MGSIDDLNSNPFFRVFQSTPAYVKAPAKKWVVVVPVASSLTSADCSNKDFIACHVLQPPEQKDEYKTLDGRTVVFRDQKLVCGAGFPAPPRTVSVLQQETYYDEQFESFEVLRISAPLIGTSCFVRWCSQVCTMAVCGVKTQPHLTRTRQFANGHVRTMVMQARFPTLP
jgi:hypothetical protein